MKMGWVWLLLLALPAAADEVEFVRVGSVDWQCTTVDGQALSNHTRVDKAFQACANRSLQDGLEYRVVPAQYRVQATIDNAPPPPDPEPEPPPSTAVTFGPVTAITEYPNTISALAQDAFRWELTFTLNDVAGIQGLASRDESGTNEPGHLTVWVDEGQLIARHQDTTQSISIAATTPIVADVEYVATVSVEAGVGIAIHLDGVVEASDPFAVGTTGNSLPLILGGRCTRCNDGVNGPEYPINGSVYLEIFDQPLDFPQPVSLELRWTPPTQYEDDTSIGDGELVGYRLYQLSPGGRQLLISLGADENGYEVTGLQPGEHCFAATALTADAESRDSNVTCKEPT